MKSIRYCANTYLSKLLPPDLFVQLCEEDIDKLCASVKSLDLRLCLSYQNICHKSRLQQNLQSKAFGLKQGIR